MAEKICGETEDSFMLQQFSNPNNPKAHYETTGPEIYEQVPDTAVFVSAAGTGGTITGTGRFLKEKNPDTHVVVVEPVESPVLSGGDPGPHKIQGIGAGFIPDALDTSIYDEIVQVPSAAAIQMSRRLATEEGMCRISRRSVGLCSKRTACPCFVLSDLRICTSPSVRLGMQECCAEFQAAPR